METVSRMWFLFPEGYIHCFKFSWYWIIPKCSNMFFFYFKIHSVILSFPLLVCLFLSLFLLETTCVFLNWQTWPLSYTRYISETDLTFISVLLFSFSLLGSIPWKSLYFINMYEKHQEMNSLSFSSSRYLYFFLYSMTSFPSESLNLYSVQFYNHVVTVPLFWSL